MAMEMKLQMRLSQQLIMTPQLQQAIKLLQLSRTELEELIDQSLIENPVLEEGIDIDTDPSPEEEKYQGDVPNTEEPEPFASAKEVEKEEPAEDMDWQQYAEFSGTAHDSRKSFGDDEFPSLEATLAQSQSLSDHLLWQLDMLNLGLIEHELGVNIIGNIGDDGYLTVSIRELLETNKELHQEIEAWVQKNPVNVSDFNPSALDHKYQITSAFEKKSAKQASPPDFEEDSQTEESSVPPLEISAEAACFIEVLLHTIQQFDPPGVGARSLQECLLVQLELLNMKDALCSHIVQQDMSLLECKDLKKIARRHKESLEDVIDAYKLIMSLEPKPGRAFGAPASHNYIIPDAYIYRSNTGDFKVTLNGSGVPRLRISGYYKNLAEHMEEDGNLTKEYIQEKIKAGQWLMKSIEQRQKTIFRVTQSILQFQKEFFEKGINFLKPLVLKDVAEDISVHESTVSRITTNKYVHTPQGIFELKYFFTSGIDQGSGETISSKRIKDMIEQLIQNEEARSPYTDLQIAKILFEKNQIRVARRTVAKYREALKILPSNKRKQLF
ncbi:MAG: RNA polymerase factor sigma-54 [SAR324 cluster bacterium]|nr:RNA polymerase factor sigma-54 [SAR324 cluster bacterium]